MSEMATLTPITGNTNVATCFETSGKNETRLDNGGSSAVDGYYYCTECGTQDVTLRETVIEYQMREDGTYAHTQTKKITLPFDKKDLSPEWYKWHAYNFMIAGFADELAALGAGEHFKKRLLWIWSKYVRAYKKKDKSRLPEEFESNAAQSISDFNDPADITLDGPDKQKRYCINKLKMSILQGMLYAALNVSESEIQAGDLRRFVKEERVSCRNCLRFIPDDFNFSKLDPLDCCFRLTSDVFRTEVLRGYTMTLFKKLNLGFPMAANLLKLVNRYMTELCLPSDFKDLVFSLMRFIPVNLEMEFLEEVPRTPNYEGVAMAYIVIGLKICFGLDDMYETVLSNAVGQYNEANGLGKAYRDGFFTDTTDRLFSFKEWSIHMEFKRQVISKYYFPLAFYCNADIDSQVFLSYTKYRAGKNHSGIDAGEGIMMEILGKLNASVESFKTPKVVFPPSLTPMVTYTDVLLSNLHNSEVKELLGEDFSQYSLKYVMGNMGLDEIEASGVSLDNAVISDETMQKRILKWKVDKTVVYIRNCENDNWLLTKPPNEEHVKTIDGVFDNATNEEEALSNEDLQREFAGNRYINGDNYNTNVVMDDDGDNIFDDDFKVPNENELWNEYQNDGMEETKYFQINENESTNINYDLFEDNHGQIGKYTFDEESFDRTAAIEKLLEIARKEYRIKDTSTKIPYKRKPREPSDAPKVKKPRTAIPKNPNRTKPGEAKKHVENILNTYYSTMFNRNQYSVDREPHMENELLPESLNNEIEGQFTEPSHEENIKSNFEDLVLDIDKENEENIVNVKDIEDETDTEIVEDEITEDPAKKLFDSNLYDISQLYLKVKDNHETTDETREDTEIIELFRQKERELESENSEPELENNDLNQTVKRATKDDNTSMKEDLANNSENTDDGIESDNISLSKLFKEMDSTNSVNLFSSRENFRPYNYWTLHYCQNNPPDSFDKELDRRFSKSFAWTLRLCASVIESSTRVLYLQVINLENDLKRRLRNQSVN